MALISNQVFRLLNDTSSGAYPAGIYRVVIDEAAINKTVCVCIQLFSEVKAIKGGRPKNKKTKNPRKKAPPCLSENSYGWRETTLSAWKQRSY